MKPTIRLNPKQTEAFQHLLNATTKYLAYGGAAYGGKTYLGCIWLITSALQYPGTRWGIGRKELKLIRQSTMLTFYQVFSDMGLVASQYCRWNGQDNIFIFKNGSRIDLIDLKYEPSDPEYTRFGSLDLTGLFLEEIGEIESSKPFDVLKTRVGRWKNEEYGLLGKILLTCNPAKNFLYYDFYKPWREGALQPPYHFVQAMAEDNQFGDQNYIDSLEDITDRITYLRLRKGQWEFSDDENSLVTYDAILRIFEPKYLQPETKKYITADIARYGGDKTVIMYWNNFHVLEIIEIAKNSIPQAARAIEDMINKYQVPLTNIAIDEQGLGGGVLDILEETVEKKVNYTPGWSRPKIIGFISNAAPIGKKNEIVNYNNLKSQCYYEMATHINKGKLYIKNSDKRLQETIITELEQQLKAKNIDVDGKLAIIPKDKVKAVIGRSPDYADTLAMRFFFAIKGMKTTGNDNNWSI